MFLFNPIILYGSTLLSKLFIKTNSVDIKFLCLRARWFRTQLAQIERSTNWATLPKNFKFVRPYFLIRKVFFYLHLWGALSSEWRLGLEWWSLHLYAEVLNVASVVEYHWLALILYGIKTREIRLLIYFYFHQLKLCFAFYWWYSLALIRLFS